MGCVTSLACCYTTYELRIIIISLQQKASTGDDLVIHYNVYILKDYKNSSIYSLWLFSTVWKIYMFLHIVIIFLGFCEVLRKQDVYGGTFPITQVSADLEFGQVWS